jgi:UDP-N-acetylglucosamine 2-epimerase (non-hydrolysing)
MQSMKPVVVVTGTRPEIIKMAPIIRALNKAKLPSVFVHCGQHYDYNMAKQFIENLELAKPDHWLEIKATSPGSQTGEILIKMDKLLEEIDPAIVHVEAGLRSNDLRMPEEHNRRLTDHISNYLFAPTERAKANLTKECVWGKIFITGNTSIDAVKDHMPIAEKKSKIMDEIRFGKYLLATTHRAENVDNATVLQSFLEVFSESPLPIVYPMHPRTKKRLQENNVLILPPIGYLDFLILMKNCQLLITDSGGIQEEATAPSIRKPVLVIRLSTERQEAVEAGFARVVGTDKKRILAELKKVVAEEESLPFTSPFGDGTAAQKTVKIIKKSFA